MSKKFAAIVSTGASVIKTVYANTCRSKFDLDLVIVDRNCGGKEFAINNNIDLIELVANKNGSISDEILAVLQQKNIDYIYLFYTRLLKGKILDKYCQKIINFHPSLLPACPGLYGFEDTIRSGSMLAGSTAHYIDSGIDTGKIILQAFTPTHSVKTSRLRHIIFSQQCATLYAIHKNIKNDLPLLNFETCVNDLAQGFLPNIDAESLNLYRTVLNQG